MTVYAELVLALTCVILSTDGQVWEGGVLPGRCGVFHRVWKRPGEKRPGGQIPLPHVRRNRGTHQVSCQNMSSSVSLHCALRVCWQTCVCVLCRYTMKLKSYMAPDATSADKRLAMLWYVAEAHQLLSKWTQGRIWEYKDWKEKFTSRINIPDHLLTPMSFKMFMSFFLQSQRNEGFEENIPGFFSI